jgi:hypothetical protein
VKLDDRSDKMSSSPTRSTRPTSRPRSPTAGVVTEEIIKIAQSLEAEKLKEAALSLSDKITTVAGVSRSTRPASSKNAFSIMQNMPGGVEVV